MSNRRHSYEEHMRHKKAERRSASEIIVTRIDKGKKGQVRGKKAVLMGIAILTVIILVAAGLYVYVIPRIDLKLTTVYHESTGGASSGGSISVNTLLKNIGTKDLAELNLSIEIFEPGSSIPIAFKSVNYYRLERGTEKQPRLLFTGDQFQPYDIRLHVEFSVGGKYFESEFKYQIGEDDAMNIVFEERIFEWDF